MKITKYLIFAVLTSMTFLISGELYQSYLSSFSDFYSVSFYMQDDIDKDTMLADIEKTAANYDIDVFAIQTDVKNKFTSIVNIYANNSVQKVLNKDFQIVENNFDSAFSGTTFIHFNDFFDITDEYVHQHEPKYYLIGDYEAMCEFKAELVDTYGGSFPKQNGYSNYGEKQNVILGIWLLVVLIMLMLSFYDVANHKKNMTLRFIFGERIGLLFFKNIMADTAVYTALFFMLKKTLSDFTNVEFFSKIAYTALITLIVLNIIPYLSMFHTDVKMAFSNKKASKKLLTMNYVLNGIAMLLTSLMVAVNFIMIKNYADYSGQRTFFEANKNASYVEIVGNDTAVKQAETALYYEFDKKNSVHSFDPCVGYSRSGKDLAHLINSNSINFLKEWMPEVFSQNLTEAGYIILPCDMEVSSDDILYLKSFLSKYLYGTDYYNNPEKIPVIKYEKNCKILSVDRAYLNYSEWVENPVIVYINKNDYAQWDDSCSAYFRTYNLIVDAPEDEIASLVQKYGCECKITNVMDYFNYRLEMLSRTLLFGVIACAMLVLLNIIIISTVIYLEFQTNALEHIISKTLGNSLWYRLKKLYVSLLLTNIFSGVLACVMSYLLNIASVFSVLCIIGIFTVFEIVIINLFAWQKERQQIQKILKGGL